MKKEKNELYFGKTMCIDLNNMSKEEINKLHECLKEINSKEFIEEEIEKEKKFKKDEEDYFMNIAKCFVNGNGNFDYFSGMNEINRCCFCYKTLVGNEKEKNECMYCMAYKKPCLKDIFEKFMPDKKEITKEEDDILTNQLKKTCIENIYYGIKFIQGEKLKSTDINNRHKYRRFDY